MTKIINLLHLSDLHFSRRNDAFNRDIILSAFRQDIKKICDKGFAPDLIIFSGDMVNTADEEDAYYHLYDELFDEIQKVTRCNDQRFIICPGNHDASRKAVEKNRDLISGLRINLKDRNSLNQAYLNGRLDNLVNETFSEYSAFSKYFEHNISYSDALVAVHSIPEFKTDIVVLNTAWNTGTGLDAFGDDERQLLLPEAALVQARRKCNDSHKKILVTHHPLNWLVDFSENDVVDFIDGNFDFHLSGHMHRARAALHFELKGSLLRSQSGALYQGRDLYNGYSILSFDTDASHSMLRFRTYFDAPRREFDTGINVVQGGALYSPPESREFWLQQARRIDRSVLKKWIIEILMPAAQSGMNDGLAERPICEVFVPPPMHKKIEVREKNQEEAPEYKVLPITLGDIVESSENYVLTGRQEYGKTTLLQQISLAIMQRVGKHDDFISLPILIEFSDIRAGRNRIVKALQTNLLAEPVDFTLNQIVEEGFSTILIDDVDFSDTARVKILREFMSEFPRNRFIFSTSSDTSDAIGLGEDVVPETGAPVSFTPVFLRPFTRKTLRSFVEKWDKDGRMNKEEVLNRIVKEFVNINLPVTAVNGTILLTIYDDLNGNALLNRAVLIERFIEHLLEKRSLAEAKRSIIDFDIKVHLLSHLSEKMARDDTYILPYETISSILELYLKGVGLASTYKSNEIVDHFVDRRILRALPGQQLSFRYRAFLEYFIARSMSLSSEFKNWVMDEDRYLRFVNEIQYYSGLVRNDANLLEEISLRFKSLTDEIALHHKWNPDLSKMNDFSVPLPDSEDNLFDEFERQMKSPPMTSEERDEALEADIPTDMEKRQEVFRPALDMPGQKWTMSLLLFSGVLKNMELIPDHKKRDHLKNILRGWGIFTAFAFYIVPALSKHRRLKINGILYEVNLPRHFSEAQVARTIYLDMPNSVSNLILTVLGTEKLQEQLLRPTLDEAEEPKIVTFFRSALISDLRLPQWEEALTSFVETLNGQRFFQEVMLHRISRTYMLGDFAKALEVKLKGLVGTLIGDLRGTDPSDRQKRKSYAIQKMEKQSILHRLRLAANSREEAKQEEWPKKDG